MTVASLTDLVATLREHQLLEEEQMDEVTAALQARYRDPSALAAELQRRGWLTPYQAEQLLAGQGVNLVLGQYRLLELLGEGGMGQVFKARHRLMKRIVALKVIRQDQLTTPLAVHRFHREIQAVAQLSHPNIVMAHDADEVGGTHFFVMEYVAGIDLARLVKDQGTLPVGQASDYIRQAALGLQHAHERGLVHRDIKPSNLLLTTTGVIKILDLGLARLRQSADDKEAAPITLTQQGAVMGTPDFMAPEQARNSHNVDIRADLYSLGCTLYYLLTGRVTFPGDTVAEKFYKHWFEEPDPIEGLRPDVSPDVSLLLKKLLAKDPAQRFQTPAELAVALTSHCAEGNGATNASIGMPGDTSNAATIRPSGEGAPETPTPDYQPTHPGAPPFPQTSPVAIAPLKPGPGLGHPEPESRRWPSIPAAPPFPSAQTERQPARAAVPEAAPSQTLPQPSRPRSRGLLLKITAIVLGLGIAVAGSFWWSGRTPRPDPAEGGSAQKVATNKDGEIKPPEKEPVVKDKAIQPPPQRVDPVVPPPAVRGPEKYALLIGVRQQDVVQELKPRPYATADMEQLAAALRSEYRPENITLLTQKQGAEAAQQPSGDNIRRELKRLAKNLTSADSLIVALVCHSVQFQGIDETFFCPSDGRLTDKQTLLTLPELYSLLKDCKAGFKLLLVDACRKQPWVDNAPPGIALEDLSRPQKVAPPDGVAVLFSCSAGEASYDGPERLKPDLVKNGVFFHHFSEAVRKGVADVEQYARSRVFADVQKNYRAGSRQTPERLRVTLGPVPLRGLESFIAVPSVGEIAVLEGGHTDIVNSVVYSPDGLMALSRGQDTVGLLWDLESRKPIKLEPEVKSVVWSVAMSADGQRALFGCGGDKEGGTLKRGTIFDDRMRLWNLTTQAEVHAFPLGDNDKEFHKDYVTSVAFSPDGVLALSGCDDGVIRLWSTDSGLFRHAFKGHKGGIKGVAFSPDGKRILSGSDDGTVRLWDVTNRTLLATLEGHPKGVRSVAFSPDGRLALSGGNDDTIRLWDLNTVGAKPHELRRFEMKHQNGVWSVAFSPDGSRALSGGGDNSVRLWDVSSGKELHPFKGHLKTVTSVAFSPDGRRALSASADKTIRMWSLPPDKRAN